MEKRRAVLSLVVAAVGLSLLTLGLIHEPAAVSPDGQDQQQVAAMSEMAITQEVARGGITRDESGEVTKTYEEGQEAPYQTDSDERWDSG